MWPSSFLVKVTSRVLPPTTHDGRQTDYVTISVHKRRYIYNLVTQFCSFIMIDLSRKLVHNYRYTLYRCYENSKILKILTTQKIEVN